MQNKDVGVRVSRMPAWIANVLLAIFCGPLVFLETLRSKMDYRRHEFVVLNIFGSVSCLMWVSALLTAVGVVPI
ncbi:MAG TPA: hypothetical protein VK145_01115, partial [Candidatus Nanoarchaeia archaeon]|nr:hypothetical protein [Candidatus Nanoarchaeia archaeon]